MEMDEWMDKRWTRMEINRSDHIRSHHPRNLKRRDAGDHRRRGVVPVHSATGLTKKERVFSFLFTLYDTRWKTSLYVRCM